MRKIYMMLTALLASFAITANAERVLYQETYEAGGVPTTWTANGNASKGVKLSLASTDASTILQWTGGSDNGRSAHDFWGTSIYEGVDAEDYYNWGFKFRLGKILRKKEREPLDPNKVYKVRLVK